MAKVKTERYSRKPFFVDAVQVTAANMEAVAEWCGGVIETTKNNKRRPPAKYINIEVHRPLNERQGKAFIGDWVLLSGSNFKVYTKSAFGKSFQKEKHNARMAQGKRAKVVRDGSGVRVVAAESTRVPGPARRNPTTKKEIQMSESNAPDGGEQAGDRQDPSEPKQIDRAQSVTEQPAEPPAPEPGVEVTTQVTPTDPSNTAGNYVADDSADQG